MIIVVFCAGAALAGFCLGLLMADKIADNKIQEMRMEAGLDAFTGEEIRYDEEDLWKD